MWLTQIQILPRRPCTLKARLGVVWALLGHPHRRQSLQSLWIPRIDFQRFLQEALARPLCFWLKANPLSVPIQPEMNEKSRRHSPKIVRRVHPNFHHAYICAHNMPPRLTVVSTGSIAPRRPGFPLQLHAEDVDRGLVVCERSTWIVLAQLCKIQKCGRRGRTGRIGMWWDK
jgi:hypothetical protein